MVFFFKSQDVKLKRMKYHDPILWGNVLKGLYSLLIWSLQFPLFKIDLLCSITLKSKKKAKSEKEKFQEKIC